MDYSVWSIFESRACSKSHNSFESPKQSLNLEWNQMILEELGLIAKISGNVLGSELRSKEATFKLLEYDSAEVHINVICCRFLELFD